MNLRNALLGTLLGVVLFSSSCASGSFAASPSRKLKITTDSLPAAVVGQSYSQQLTASGGTGSYLWSVTSGALPPGIALSVTGVISGRPASSGQFTFTIQVVDSKLAKANVQITLRRG